MNVFPRFWIVFICLVTMIFGGCAIQRDSRGRQVISTDIAQLLGEVMDERPMPDGSMATLRRLDGQWCLKFGVVSRMVSLGKLANAKILRIDKVGESTNILLATISPNCQQTVVLVNLGRDIAKAGKWDIVSTSCRSNEQPQVYVQAGENEEIIDVVRGGNVKRLTRFIYKDGEVYRTREVALPKEQSASSSGGAEKGRTASVASAKPTPTSVPAPTSMPATPIPKPQTAASPSAPGAVTVSDSPNARSSENFVIPAHLDFGKPVRHEKVVVDLM